MKVSAIICALVTGIALAMLVNQFRAMPISTKGYKVFVHSSDWL